MVRAQFCKRGFGCGAFFLLALVFQPFYLPLYLLIRLAFFRAFGGGFFKQGVECGLPFRFLPLFELERVFFCLSFGGGFFFFRGFIGKVLSVCLLLLFGGCVRQVEIRKHFLAFKRSPYHGHLLSVQRDEDVGQSGKEACADNYEDQRGDDGFAYSRVRENGVVRFARDFIGDKSVAFVHEREYHGGNYRAYRGNHRLEVLRKALYSSAHLVLLRVETVRHNGGLDYVLRTVCEVVKEKRNDKEYKALLESKVHYGCGQAVCEMEDESRLTRAQLGYEQRSQYNARSETDGRYRLHHALNAAVAQLIGAHPRQKGGQHAFESVKKSAQSDKPEFLVFGKYFHTVQKLYLVHVRLGQNHALLSIVQSDKAHKKADNGKYGHKDAVSPNVLHRRFAEEDKSQSGQQKLYHAGTKVAQKFGKAHYLCAFGRRRTYDLRYARLSVRKQRLGNAEQVEENAYQHYLHRHISVYGDEPRQSDYGYHGGNARPENVGAEFAYRGVGVVHQHADKRRFDDAHHVGHDEQPHQIARAQSVYGSRQKAGCGHLYVREQGAEVFQTH